MREQKWCAVELVRRMLVCVTISGILLVVASGVVLADPKDYVGIIRPELTDKTKAMFEQLSEDALKANQEDVAAYYSAWARGAWWGSGWVFVDDDGSNYIITNRHVAEQAEKLDFQLEQPDGAVKTFNNCPILYVSDEIDLAVAQFPDEQKVYSKSFSLNTDI